jgi:hypothetical protein
VAALQGRRVNSLKAIFWVREERHLEASDWRENDLAEAIKAGARAHDDQVEIREVTDSAGPVVEPCDLVLKIGVKSRNWFRAYNAAGIPYAYFDKGYIRKRAPVKWLEYWRVSVNGHQPLRYVESAKHDEARATSMGFELHEWRNPRGDCIVVDGSSGKHCYFHADRDFLSGREGKRQLDDYANAQAADLVRRVSEATDRPIVYRPKPSWKGAKPIQGTEYARGRAGVGIKDFDYDIRRAHVVVTNGSNLCFDAVMDGVPSIVLGNGIAAPISSRSLSDIESPRLASHDERRQWLNNCAWCQFKLEEFRSGMGWQVIKDMVACSR